MPAKETAQQQVLVAEILIVAGERAVANSLSTASDYNGRGQLFRRRRRFVGLALVSVFGWRQRDIRPRDTGRSPRR